MRLKHFLSVFLTLLTLSVGQMWGATTTLAGWTFTSSSYPGNKTNFTATTGTMTTNSTFYLNGGGSTWNTGAGKGYAFTSVTDIDITLKLTQAVPAGTVFTLSATSFYNKASNAPMKSFDVTVKEGTGSFSTTGVTTTNWSLGTSSASKSSTYTTQAALASGSTIVFKLTGKDKAGSGQGYIGNITITATTYNVTYNGNSNTGGSVPTDNVKYITGTTVTVKANSGSLVRTNYTFGGWNTNTSGTGTNYAAGSGSFTITADKTLYAKWNAEAVSTPTLELTGSGAFGNVDVDATKDLNFTLAGSNLTANASVEVTGTGFELITPSNGTLTQTAGSITGSNNITVRFAPTAGGAHNGTLTVSSTGASNASVSLSGTGQLSDTFIDELHSTTGYTSASPHVEKGSYGTTPTIADKPTATSVTCAQQHYHFVGWITAAKFEAGTSIAVGDLQSPTSATGATYYAVWAKASAGASFNGSTGGDFLIYANVSGTNKYATNTISSGGLSTTTTASNAQVYTFTKSGDDWTISYQDGNTTKYLTAPTGNDGNLSAFSTTASTWKIVTGTYGTWRIYSRSSDKNGNNTYSHRGLYYQTTANAFKNYATSNVDGTTYYDCEIGSATTYTDYKAVCCTELGSINGSVSWTNAAATVSWEDVNGFGNTWALKYKKTTDEDTPAKWSTYSGSFGSANNRKSNSTAISNLEAGTSYDFKVTGTYSGSAYCAQGYTFTFSSVVPKITTGAVSGASTYKVGYGPGTKQTFTVSAVGLDDDLTVSAPTNFLVCKTENGTYTSSVTLNHSEGTVASTTLYVQLAAGLAEKNYNANVGISGGGAASVNVAVSGVVSPDCSDPTIDSDPEGATYNLNATATDLEVEATNVGTGPALSYQWYSNTANSTTTPTPTALVNCTTSTYKPSTATAGTKYYFCVVSSGACSTTSGIAAVTVNTPIISVGDNKTSVAFGSKAIGSETEEIISISGTTLAKDQNISLAIDGAGAGAYSLSKYELEASNGTVTATNVTITYTAVSGSSEATLTISSEGAESKEIALSGLGKYQATFIANGNSESILVDGEGKLVLPASNPSSCNGTYSTFIGWYSTAAGSNGDPTTNIASCGTKAVTTHMLESNETYYAVWGNGSLVADDVKQVTLDFTDNTNWQFPTTKTFKSDSYTNENDVTVTMGGVTSNGWNYNGTQYYLLFGKNGCSMTFSAFDFATSKIVVTGKGGASPSTVENIYVGDEAVSTATTGSAGTNTYEIADNYQAAGTIYSLKVGSDHNAQVTTIEFYSPGSGAATGFISSCCSTWDAPTVSYSVPSDWKVGDPAVNVSVSGTTHGTASYESSDPTVVSVDSETGAITPEKVGTATITVTWSGEGYCDKAVTTAPITVHGYVDVTFNGNGAEGSMIAQPVEVGVSTALNTNTFTAPACKEFGGWATSSDGEAIYTDGGNITASNATTLWAVWNTKTLSVAQGTGTAVGCEGNAFTFASSVACGGNVTITSSPDATHKAPFSITVLPIDAYEEIDGNVIKNVTKPITSISVSYTAKTSYAITWKVNDAPYAPHQEEEDGKVNGDALVYEGNTITTLPTAPADNTLGCANKFMGWSTHDYKSVKKAASDYSDLFTAASGAPEITKATTFYAVFATQSGTPAADHDVFATSSLGSTNTVTTGYAVSAQAASKTGYYQDGTADVGAKRYVQIRKSDTSSPMIASTPATVTVTATLGAGAAQSLSSNVYAIWLDASGNEIDGTEVELTDEITNTNGSDFEANLPAANATSAYGVRIYHEKEDGFNVRYYAISLSYTTGGMTTTDYVTECAAVEAPTFSPAAGTYNEAQSVELSSTTVGADIYYTTNGSTPTSSSTPYTGAIAVNQNMTIKAIAIKGSDESDVAEAAYVLQVATPTISGTTNFVNSTTVTIEATGADAIYYTTNGSDPTTESTPYTAPFTVDADGTTTVKAIAIKANWTNSKIASQAFTKITPMTVATALTNIDALANNGTIEDQYVKGLISEINSYNNGTITYYISDDGTTSSQLQVYRGSAGVANGGNAFTSVDDLKVGEEVVVFGTLKKYKSGSNPVIPEFVNPNEIVAYKPYAPIAWSANAYTAELGGSSNVFPSLSGTAGLTISYSSSDPTKASFADASVYDITLNAVTGGAPVVITATSAANEQYVATSVSYNLTVEAAVVRYSLSYVKNGGTSDATDSDGATETNLPNPLPTITKAGYNFGGWYTDSEYEHLASAGAALTENTTLYAQWEDPYTVSVALAKSATTGVYVQGVISTITEVSTQHGNATYKISADGTASGEMIVYRGKFTGNVSFTAADQIQLGDEVVIYGDLTEHDNAMQLAQGNYIYSLVRPTYNVTGVTLPSTANVRAGKTVALTATITPSNATNKNVTWSVTSGSDYAEVSDAGVVTGKAEGTATIQVETEDGGFTATCTVTVAGALPNFATDATHEWIKVTSDTKLQAGRFYVIAREAANYTMTKNIDSYAGVATSTIENGVIAYNALGSNTAIFELGGTSSAWTLTEVSTDAVLGATTGKNFSWEDNQEWTIAIDENKDVSITNTTSSCGVICYNTSATPRRFKPYADASTTCPLPQLYMWAELSHSVTFNANGGVAESVPGVERTDEGKIIIPATEPTHSDVAKAFAGWYESPAGTGTKYEAGDEFSTNVDVTLYAKWNTVPTYTVTYVPGGDGEVPAVASYREGQKVQVEEASLSNPGYSFAGWTVKDAEQIVLPLDEDNKFEMPASNVTITAVWSRISSQKWKLVEYGDELVIDAEYVIAYNSNTVQKALGAISSSVGTAINVTIDGDYLKGSEAMTAFTLVAGNNGENYAFQNGSKYLTWSSGNSLSETETTPLSTSSSWTIEIDENNKVDIKNVGTTTRYLQYNAGSPRFACYTNTQQKVLLFKKVANLIVEDEQTKTAAQVDASDITVKENGKLTINVDADEKEIGDITVEDGGELIITGSKHIKANNVYLSSTMASGKSSQMSGALAQLDIQGEVYFDITLGDNGNANKWHAFTVPFPVDAINGVFDLNNTKLNNEEHYAIMEYHGDIRATGAYGWKKYRKTLVPGTFYLMTVDGLRTTYRFKKTADGALVAGNTKDLEEYPLNGGTEEHNDNGWNGVGNPTLRYGQVAYKVQVLNPTSYTYEPFEANETNFVVGTPFFIQANAAAAAADMTFGAASGEANYAPARTPAKGIESVKVTFGNEEYKDRLYISASEDALNRYETGKDLAKMTMTSTPKVAQIFGKAYNSKLCMVYAPMANDQAVYDLTLYAPANGEYTIAAPNVENADLYLTYEGNIIWNLSMSAYPMELKKGNTEGYGLLLNAKAPMSPTGVETVTGDGLQVTGVQKIILDEKVFILRGGKMYDVTGKAVK